MTQVLIISDSHGLTEELSEIKNRYPDIKHRIHCGDSELRATELKGFYKVAGNCDFDKELPNEQVVKIGDLTFLVVHGHLHSVKANLMNLSYRGSEVGANVLCFGHTHIAGAKKLNDQLFLNPGSIRLPRSRKEPTYAIMKWDTIADISVDFYTVDGEKVEELSYQMSLEAE